MDYLSSIPPVHILLQIRSPVSLSFFRESVSKIKLKHPSKIMWFSPMGISPLVLYCPPFKKWTALSIDCHRRYPCHHKLCSLLYPSRKTCPCYRSILLPCYYSFPSRISILSYSPLQLPPPYQTTSPPTHPITKPDFFPGWGVLPKNIIIHIPPLLMFLIPPSINISKLIFQHKVTGARSIAKNITEDTLLCGDCDLHRLLPLLRNLTLRDDNLLGIKNFMIILPCPSLPTSSNIFHPSSLFPPIWSYHSSVWPSDPPWNQPKSYLGLSYLSYVISGAW